MLKLRCGPLQVAYHLLQDVRINDRLIATEERKVESVFYPKPPEGDIHGHIIHVFPVACVTSVSMMWWC